MEKTDKIMEELMKAMKNTPKESEVKKLVKKIRSKLIKYDKENLLNWISLTSILEGNEIYQFRFSFLIRVIFSIPDSEFHNDIAFDSTNMKELFVITKDLSWMQVEDYTPRKNNLNNSFGFENKEYYFFPGGLDHPENQLESIPKRYMELLKDVKNFDINKEFVNILEKQSEALKFSTSLISSRDENLNLNLPNKEDVKNWEQILISWKGAFSNVWQKDMETEPLNSISINIEDNLIKNPICKGKVYAPYILINALLEKLKNLLESNLNQEKRIILNKQLLLEVLNSLTEIIPNRAIYPKLKVNGNGLIDLGFIYDNKFFMFFLIEEKFDPELFLKEIDNKLKTVQSLEDAFDNEVEITSEEMDIKISRKLDPIFITIIDDLDFKMYPPTFTKKGNSITMSCNALRFIFENLSDERRSVLYLKKTIKKFNELIRGVSFGFADFYDFLSKGGNYSFKYLKKGHIMIDPHFWSESEIEIMKKRKRIDYRPKIYENPFTFKVKNTEKDFYVGYNNILLHYFYLIKKGNSRVFVLIEGDSPLEEIEGKMMNFLGAVLSYIILKIPRNSFIPKEEFLFRMVPMSEAKRRGLPKEMQKHPLSAFKAKDGEIHVIFDPVAIMSIYSTSFEQLINFLFGTITKQILRKNKFNQTKKQLDVQDIIDNFKIGKIPTNSRNIFTELSHPTEIELADIEIEILKFLKEKNVSEGIYQAEEADKIIKDLYDFFLDKLNNELKHFNLKSLVNFGLFESESIIRERNLTKANLIYSSKSKFLEETKRDIIDRERILRSYFPSVRYVVEQALFNGFESDEEFDIERWQYLTSLAFKIMEFCSIIEFLRKNSDLMKVELKIDFSEMAHFGFRLEGNPLEEQIKKSLEYFTKEGTKIEDHFPEPKEVPSNFTEEFEQKFEEFGFKKINDFIKRDFGFSIPEYVYALNIMTHLHEKANKYGIISIKKQELINFILEKTSLSKGIINSILKFSTLYGDGKKALEPWRINTRKDRMTIKPLVEMGDEIIFSIELMIFAEENVFKTIFMGDWPYLIDDSLSNELKLELEKYRQSLDKKLEDDLFDELKKETPYCDKRILSGEKCFKNIEEKSPGEVDCLSIHLSKKIILVWEAKNIMLRFGAREIMNDLDEFTSHKGYIEKLVKKENFVKKHLKKILKYYGVEDYENWKISYCIVFSSNSPLKNILEKKFKVIELWEIKEFIKTNLE